MIRTAYDGVTAGQTDTFTPGVPNTLYTPSAGVTPGLPPCVFITGGGIRANVDPAATGFDRILEIGCDDYGFSFGQVDLPWALANDLVQPRITDALAWLRNPAKGINASNDDLCGLGYSNGAICLLRWGLDNDVTALAECLAPVDNDQVYTTNYGSGQGVFEDAWAPYIPALKPYTAGDHLPDRGSPWGHADDYQHLRRKVILFGSASDYIFAPQYMSFFTQIAADIVNIGPIGHVGTWGTTWLAEAAPADRIDADRLFGFWQERIALL